MMFFAGLQPVDYAVMLFMLAGLALTLWRFWMGPYTADRIVAADTLAVLVTALLVLLAMWFDSVLYLDVALIYAVLAFAGTVALAHVIERGEK